MPQAQKSGFFSKLAKAAPIIGRIAGALGSAYGNPSGANAWREHDAQARQRELDDLNRQRVESGLSTDALQRKQLEAQLGSIETPQQKDARVLDFERRRAEQEREIAPPTILQQGNRILERRYDPQSKQFITDDPMQAREPLSIPMGSARGEVKSLIHPKLDANANMPIRESAPMALPPARSPMMLNPRVHTWQNVQNPDGSFARVPFDAQGNRIDDASALAPSAFYDNKERSTTSTGPMGEVRTTVTTGGGKNVGGPQPLISPPPSQKPSVAGPPAPSGREKLVDDAIAAIESGASDIKNYPQKPDFKTPSKDEITRRAQSTGKLLLNKEERGAIQEVQRALALVNEIDEISKKIHTESTFPLAKYGSGMMERGAQITTANPDLSRLDTVGVALRPLLRTLGEKGAISNKDIEGAEKSLPISAAVHRTDASAQLDTVRNFINTAMEGIARTKGRTAAELFGGNKPTPSGSSQPRVGDTKVFPNGKTGKWDGNGWELVPQ